MTRTLIPWALALGCTPADSGPRINAIGDQTVVRNMLAPRSAQVPVDVVGVSVPFDVRLTSSDEGVVPSQEITCGEVPCTLTLTPSPERTATVAVTAAVSTGDRTLRTDFEIRLVPRLVVAASDGIDAPEGSLRETLAHADDGDVVAFDVSGAFADPTVIELAAPLEVPGVVRIEGPGRDRLSISGMGAHGVFVVGTGAQLDVRDVTVTEGVRERGGGIDVASGGRLDVRSCRFSHNDAEYGGAIHADRAVLAIAESIFESNHSDQDGGAIYAERTEMSIEDGLFGGDAPGAGNDGDVGGAIAMRSGTHRITNTEFVGNRGFDGGALSARVANGEAPEAVVTIRSSSVRGTEASVAAVDLSGISVLESVAIVGNEVGQVALELRGASAALDDVDVSDNVTRKFGGIMAAAFINVIRNSRIVGNGTLERGGAGGGVIAFTHVVIEDSEISGNVAPSVGGGLSVQSGGEVTVRRSVISGNLSTLGGGVFVDGLCSLTLEEGTEISDNLAAEGRGGGVYVGFDGVLDVADATIGSETAGAGNHATYGGGVYSEGSTTVGAGVVIANNLADNAGGGLFLGTPSSGRATFALLGAEIRDNRAENRGGGFYIGDGTNMTATAASTVRDNEAGLEDGGGGIYISRPPPADVVTAICTDLDGRVFDNVDGLGQANDVEPLTYCP